MHFGLNSFRLFATKLREEEDNKGVLRGFVLKLRFALYQSYG